jgi:phosphatidylserine/phosphatidylglycerophosphate/cardiolipin synthase-like enzyme
MARSLAHELTGMVSANVGRITLRSNPDHPLLRRLPCFPSETWSVHTLAVPWEAFHAAHGRGRAVDALPSVKALCSAPVQLDTILAEQAANSGLWGGSLLVALGKILEATRNSIVIFSPYWRVDGVRSLLSNANRDNYAGVNIRVFTQTACFMKADDRDALKFFIAKMRESGAIVQAFSPRTIGGLTPFLHAKLIVADSNKAYVGSANFTSSGLDHGIEVGVVLEGEVASAFAIWASALQTACNPW